MSDWSMVTVGREGARVRVWSAGSGRPLVFLHGFEGHPGETPFLQGLAESRRVIAPEHPGFGESDGSEQVESVLDVVLHLRQLLEALGVERADFVGHSLGGMFAA